jgi:RHS repeat-associated protein
MKSFVLTVVTCVFLVSTGFAQVATGQQPFGSFGGGPFDSINLGSLNTSLRIPVVDRAGRGVGFSYTLAYDSSTWVPTGSPGNQRWQPVSNWGWRGITEAVVGYVEVWSHTDSCVGENLRTYYFTVYEYEGFRDRLGVYHYIGDSSSRGAGLCYILPWHAQGALNDGSGLAYDGWEGRITITEPSGVAYTPSVTTTTTSGVSVTEPNGNRITSTSGSSFIDTLGQTALSVTGSGTPSSPLALTYPAPTGSVSTTVSYKSYQVQTNFQCPNINSPSTNITEYNLAANLVDRITLPDNTYYEFCYEATPGNTNNCDGTYRGPVTARLRQVKLPTGGKILYTYTGSNNGISCADGSAMGFTRQTPDTGLGMNDPKWTYSRSLIGGMNWQTTVAAPGGEVTEINFQHTGDGFYETKRIVHSGGAQTPALTTVHTCYTSAAPSCTDTAVSLPITQRHVYTQIPDSNGKTSKVLTVYATTGLPTDTYEYDFGSGGNPGGLLRRTNTVYARLGNIAARPSEVTVRDGADAIVAKTTYAYDQTPIVALSGTPQHVAVTGSRGNPTTITDWTDIAANTTLIRTFSYYDTGLVQTARDANNAGTTYNFADATTTCGNAFPTSVSLPLSLSRSMTWNCAGGVMASSTDENQRTTTFTYGNATRWLPTQVDYPDGGQTTTAYNFTAPGAWNVVQSQKVDATRTTSVQTNLDGLGRAFQVIKTASDTTDIIKIDTTFDSAARVHTVSNPYISTGETTYGVTTYSYDALGRQTTITNPDGSTKLLEYGGSAVTVSDEGYNSIGGRVQRTLQYDALARLKSVCEATAGITWNGDTGTNCNLDVTASGFTTTYAYNLLDNLTSVTQGSLASRTYTYDSLGRLTSEAHPETGGTAGGTTYIYSSAGDLYQRKRPKQNQFDSGVLVTTTYSYDALHRLTQISYDDSVTPSVYYNYDETSAWTQNITNGKGRLTTQYVGGVPGTAGTLFHYDSMGRVLYRDQCTPSTCGSGAYAIAYLYNKAGKVTQASNGVWAGTDYIYSYFSYNASQQLTGVTSNYTPNGNYPGTYLSSLAYNPLGQLTGGTMAGGIELQRSYDKMGRLHCLADVKNSNNYIYTITGPGSDGCIAYHPNGNLKQVADSVNGSWKYEYDEFNRLAYAGTGTTNLLLYSEQIDHSPWVPENGATVMANDPATTDPNGNTAADRITSPNYHSDVYQFVNSETVAPGKQYTFSVWLKAPVPTAAAINIDRGPNGLDYEGTGVFTVGTTWQRYTFTHSGTWTDSYPPIVGIAVNGGPGSYIWAWGAQLEAGNSMGAYVATTSGEASTTTYTYDYDRYGNRWHQNMNGTDSPSYVFVDNRISSMTYDAVGNIINDRGHTYTYDAEGRMISVDGGATASYQYDAEGNRVAATIQGTSYEYLYDLNHHMVTVLRLPGPTWWLGEIYAGNWHIGSYANSTVYFNHADWLGTIRMRTDPNGVPDGVQSFTSLPFGDWLNRTVYSPSHFTDQPRDTESGLDHFLFRQYSSTQGRWMTPDPAGLAAVDPANPQTWNRYAYVMGNPINLFDPLGLECAGAVTGAGTAVAGVPSGQYTFSASVSAPCPPSSLGSSLLLSGVSLGRTETRFGILKVTEGEGRHDYGGGNHVITNAKTQQQLDEEALQRLRDREDAGKPSCFANFLKNTWNGFWGSFGPPSGTTIPEIISSSGASAATVLTPPVSTADEAILAAQHFARYGSAAGKRLSARMVTRGGAAFILINVIIQEGVALRTEYDQVVAGECQ